MKSNVALLLCVVFLSLLTAGCSSERSLPEFVRRGCVNSVVRDTLFVTLSPDYEDEWCSVEVRTVQVDFHGREQVRNGRVSFDVRTFPAAYYTVWIKVGDLYFRQKFYKE